ncbi:hypothetical protein EDC04DRAFT_2727500, partial [Pisolithus marmoratus]
MCKDTLDGREAVDKVATIIKTTGSNLALLLGHASMPRNSSTVSRTITDYAIAL